MLKHYGVIIYTLGPAETPFFKVHLGKEEKVQESLIVNIMIMMRTPRTLLIILATFDLIIGLSNLDMFLLK